MTLQCLRPGAEIAAIHEAGHAVIAVHLGVPIDRVQLSSYWIDPLSIFQQSDLSGGGVSFLAGDSRQLTERATISAASRAAVDTLIRPGAHPETAYSDDEDCLKEIAKELGVTDFQGWRSCILDHARELLGIASIRAAILRVADELQVAPLDDGLTESRYAKFCGKLQRVANRLRYRLDHGETSVLDHRSVISIDMKSMVNRGR